MWTLPELSRMAADIGCSVTPDSENTSIQVKSDKGFEIVCVITDDEITMQGVLAPVSDCKDATAFNHLVLKQHHLMFPLSTVAISTVAGDDYYVAFNTLSCSSTESSIIREFDAIFTNLEDMTEAFSEFFS